MVDFAPIRQGYFTDTGAMITDFPNATQANGK